VSKHVAQLTARLQSMRRSQFAKTAELGGSGRDLSFEQAFSNLAHAYLRETAPSLLEHEVGFQLVDRNQDNSKAVGIIAFKVGEQWVYAPSFWLNGDLKGNELLYLKNQDLFVPLKENWLNYLTNRKPDMLGEGVDRNTSQLGVMRPDLNRLRYSPDKFAAARPSLDEMIKAAMPAFAHVVATAPAEWSKFAGLADLPTFLQDCDLDTLDFLVKAAQKHPVIAKCFEQFHGPLDEALRPAIKTAGQRLRMHSTVLNDKPLPKLASRYPRRFGGSVFDEAPAKHPIKTGALKVLTHENTHQDEPPGGLDEEDQEKLLRDGLLIQDNRDDDEVAVAYNTQVESRLKNPTEPGLYMVLAKDGEFKRCFVGKHPVGADGRVNGVLVVALEGDKNWLLCHPSHVWVAADYIPGADDVANQDELQLNSWWEGLPEATTLPAGGRHILVGPGGECTCPVKREKEHGSEQGTTVYEVDCDTYMTHRYAENMLGPDDDRMFEHNLREYDSFRDGCRVHLNGKQGTTLRSDLGDIYVPAGFKILRVEPDESDADGNSNSDDPVGVSVGRSKTQPLRPGNVLDRHLGVVTKWDGQHHQKTDPTNTDSTEKQSWTLGTPKDAERWVKQNTDRLAIWSDGNEAEVNRVRMPLKAAFVHLVRDHGFREKTARELLKTSHWKPKAHYEVVYPQWVKQARSPYLRDSAVGAGAFIEPEEGGSDPFFGSRVPTRHFGEEEYVIPGLEGSQDPEVYNPNPDRDRTPMDLANVAARASQSGQREVFDTAMISQMLKAVRDDTMIDRYLGDLTKGLDRLGRILFTFYWHGDDLAERYGKEDLPELEDSLRNAFEQVGDVLLFLRQKTVEPYPEEIGFDINPQES